MIGFTTITITHRKSLVRFWSELRLAPFWSVFCLLMASVCYWSELSVRVTLRLATSPLRATTRIFIFQLNICGHRPYVTSSLMRVWVCRLQLLLVLASALILGSEFRGTHDHILLSQIRDFPPILNSVLFCSYIAYPYPRKRLFIPQQRAGFQESISLETRFSTRFLAMGLHVTIFFVYVLVFFVVSVLHIFLPKLCMHFSFLLCVLSGLPISPYIWASE
jgi:hypothetical protein